MRDIVTRCVDAKQRVVLMAKWVKAVTGPQ